jgi:hypothetical protein
LRYGLIAERGYDRLLSSHYVAPVGFLHGRGYPGICKVPKAARDEGAANRLWDVSMELTRVEYLFTP